MIIYTTTTVEAELQPLEPDEVEELPQATEPRALALREGLPAVQLAGVAAAGGFVAGAITVAAVAAKRRRSKNGRGLIIGRRKKQLPAEGIFSRSFLIDVHMLGK